MPPAHQTYVCDSLMCRSDNVQEVPIIEQKTIKAGKDIYNTQKRHILMQPSEQAKYDNSLYTNTTRTIYVITLVKAYTYNHNCTYIIVFTTMLHHFIEISTSCL